MNSNPIKKHDKAGFDEASLNRKLENLNRSADCIQTVSLWILHHRNHHEKIVQQWFNHLQDANSDKRLYLFYLANDIIQNCIRKNAHIFHEQFLEYVTKSIPYLRCNRIRGEIERIFVIWRDRHVYPRWNVDRWIGDLRRESKASTDKDQLVADYKPQQLCNLLDECRLQCEQFSAKRQALSTYDLSEQACNFRGMTAYLGGKEVGFNCQIEKSKGEEYQAEIQTLRVRCQQLSGMICDQLKMRKRLIEMLEQAMLFYEMQYSDAKVVASAYKNFGTKVNDLKRKLNELKQLLPKSQNCNPVIKRKRPNDHIEKDYCPPTHVTASHNQSMSTIKSPSPMSSHSIPHFTQPMGHISQFHSTPVPQHGAVHQAAAMLVAYSSQMMHPSTQTCGTPNLAPFAPAYFYQPANADVDCRFGAAMMSSLPMMPAAQLLSGAPIIPGASFMPAGSIIPGSIVPSDRIQMFGSGGSGESVAAAPSKHYMAYDSPKSCASVTKEMSRSRSSSRSHSISRGRHK